MKVSRSIMLTVAGLTAIAGLSGCGGDNLVSPLSNLDTTPPPAPTNLTRDNDSNGLPVLVWTESAAPDLAGYKIYVYSAGSSDYVPVDDTVQLGATFVIPSDTYGTTASYRVRAVDVTGNWSALSAAVDIYIPTLTGGGGGGPIDNQ